MRSTLCLLRSCRKAHCMLDYLPAYFPAIADIRKVAFMSSNTLLLLVHETLSFYLGVQTLAGLHGQHNEAVFSANWFNRHALSNITGCQSVIASASVINTLLGLALVLMWQQPLQRYQVDDKRPSCTRRGGAPSLRVRTLAGLHGQHHVYVFLRRSKTLSNTRW